MALKNLSPFCFILYLSLYGFLLPPDNICIQYQAQAVPLVEHFIITLYISLLKGIALFEPTLCGS